MPMGDESVGRQESGISIIAKGGKKMKRLVIAVTVLVAMLALPVALCAQESDPVTVVMALYEAVNAGDIEAALALYADDAVIFMPVAPPNMPDTYTGKEEVRAWIESEVAMNTEYILLESQVDGTTVVATTSVADDVLRSFGLTSLVQTDEFTIEDGKIAARTIAFTEESLATLGAAVATLPETGGPSLAGTLPLWLGAGGLLITSLGLGLRRLSGASR
jgi:ketosteroid isomerase-like protein